METFFPEMFPRDANEETFAEEANVSGKLYKHFCFAEGNLSPQQMFLGAADGETIASATMFHFLVAVSLHSLLFNQNQ